MVIQLPRYKGKVAVVTGASAGIGAAICEQLVEAGVKVVGLARRVDKVEALAKKLTGKTGKLYAIQTDVCNEVEVVKAFQWTKTNVGPVHILVNNAGVLRNTTLIGGDPTEWKKCIDTNLMGLCICTKEAIKIMQENQIDGHIIHINSIVGHMVPMISGSNVYPATKHGVTALAETLRFELNNLNSKIKITSLSPGVVNTEIFAANNLTEITKQLNIEDKNCPILQSDDVADAVLYALSTPPHVNPIYPYNEWQNSTNPGLVLFFHSSATIQAP